MSNVKMNLKDAYRYSRHISDLMDKLSDEIMYYDGFNDLIYNQSEVHYKSHSNPMSKDEEKELTTPNKYKIKNINDLLRLFKSLRDEKVLIMQAIEEAKKELLVEVEGAKVTIDTAIQYNIISRDNIVNIINHVLKVESKEIDEQGQDYLLNEEKNQVPYVYPIKSLIKVNYDRAEIESAKSDILLESDNISKQIDELNNKNIINFKPKYSVYDTIYTISAKLYE